MITLVVMALLRRLHPTVACMGQCWHQQCKCKAVSCFEHVNSSCVTYNIIYNMLCVPSPESSHVSRCSILLEGGWQKRAQYKF